MTRVKICGITNLEDARAAVDYGADALGYILVEGSPRFISLQSASEIGQALQEFPLKIAVIADFSERTEKFTPCFDAIQHYTNEKKIILRGSHRIIRAVRVRDERSLDSWKTDDAGATMLLLDTYHKEKLGGSGETFNWELALEAKKRFNLPLILAGGLTPENVEEAIAKVQPYAVDVSSGVEAEPGRKDHAKLKAFIRAVKRSSV